MRTSLDAYLLATADGNGHIDGLTATLAAFGKHIRYASEQATELKDADTADIFTEIARGIDKWLWFIETSQQAGRQLSGEGIHLTLVITLRRYT